MPPRYTLPVDLRKSRIPSKDWNTLNQFVEKAWQSAKPGYVPALIQILETLRTKTPRSVTTGVDLQTLLALGLHPEHPAAQETLREELSWAKANKKTDHQRVAETALAIQYAGRKPPQPSPYDGSILSTLNIPLPAFQAKEKYAIVLTPAWVFRDGELVKEPHLVFMRGRVPLGVFELAKVGKHVRIENIQGIKYTRRYRYGGRRWAHLLLNNLQNLSKTSGVEIHANPRLFDWRANQSLKKRFKEISPNEYQLAPRKRVLSRRPMKKWQGADKDAILRKALSASARLHSVHDTKDLKLKQRRVTSSAWMMLQARGYTREDFSLNDLKRQINIAGSKIVARATTPLWKRALRWGRRL